MSVAGLSLLTATRRGGWVLDWVLHVWLMRLWICAMFWIKVLARAGSTLREVGGISLEVSLLACSESSPLSEDMFAWFCLLLCTLVRHYRPCIVLGILIVFMVRCLQL